MFRIDFIIALYEIVRKIEKYVNFDEKYDDCDRKKLKTGLIFIYLVKPDIVLIHFVSYHQIGDKVFQDKNFCS